MSRENAVSIIVLVASMLGGAAVAVWSGKLILWDLRNYHFYNAHVLATGRLGYDLNPAFFQSYINPTFYLPFYFLSKTLPDYAVGAILGALHGLNVWLLYIISDRCVREVYEPLRRKWQQLVAILAVCIGAAGPIFLPLLGSSSADEISALLVLGGLTLLLTSPAGSAGAPRCAAASLVFGVALGAKLTNAVFVIAFGAVFVLWRARQPAFIRTLAGVAGAGALGVLLGGGIWMGLLWDRFESPLFPFYNAVFQSPFTEPANNFRDMRFIPESYWAALTRYPFDYLWMTKRTLETPFRDPRWALLLVLAVTWGARRALGRLRSKPRVATEPAATSAAWMLLAFTGISYAIWLGMFAIQRYLLPAELLAGPCIVLLLGMLWRSHAARATLLAATLACVVWLTEPPRHIWTRVPWSGRWLQVEVPPIERPDETTVLMLVDGPSAYVVPFFPEPVRFVRVMSGRFEGYGLWDRLETFVRDPDTTLLTLLPAHGGVRKKWRVFLEMRDIEIDRSRCRDVLGENETFMLCETRRL